MITRLIISCLLSCLTITAQVWSGPDRSTLQVADRTCATETGRGSASHEDVLNRLNTRRIVFIGDSVTRYQYLELAWYAIHGQCPDQNKPNYILSEPSFGVYDWNFFYRKSSELLTVDGQDFKARETCFCSRTAPKPGSVFEQRAFYYEDAQGRSFSLHHLQYFTEAHGPMKNALVTAEALLATHVVPNLGVWLGWKPPGCGDWDENGDMTNSSMGCPSMPMLCDKYEQSMKGNSSYELLWNGAVPTIQEDKIVDFMNETHQLNAATRCNLNERAIIDRRGAIDALEPDRSQQRRFWWQGQGPHVHAEANHAFNSALLAKLDPVPPKSAPSSWGLFSRGAR